MSAISRTVLREQVKDILLHRIVSGQLKPGEIWRQEGILGTVFQGSIEVDGDGMVLPSIRGRAWITGETTLHFASDDPFARGIRF